MNGKGKEKRKRTKGKGKEGRDGGGRGNKKKYIDIEKGDYLQFLRYRTVFFPYF